MELSDHYNALWKDSIIAFKQGRFQYDEFIDNPLDNRRGVTLLIRPDEIIKDTIEGFLKEVAGAEPNQYYYPKSDMHTTIMSIISCYAGFDIQQVDVDLYADIITDCIRPIGHLSVEYHGVTASTSGIMIQGFPNNEELNLLRERLRSRFKNSQLEQSIDKRYSIRTAHITVVRFRKPLKDSERLLRLLDQYRSYTFGTLRVEEFELVFNDWYQRASLTQKLKVW